ncbi:hypothetical protein BD626DRAFT_570780 [Schizophyllum amplum]|uniref:Uncharacterized protein n=1 Tax=Schizophyllum amplum TaxID=97359 RepID=A0A550C9V0_9AGAR|nr:hypothetical protein BD626DRAFT_570780 [Auriculariopsis ampla]
MNRSKFIREANGTIVALDFGEACFLPPVSFFDLALGNTDSFTSFFRGRIPRQPSVQLNGLLVAQGALVQGGNNEIGLPDELK